MGRALPGPGERFWKAPRKPQSNLMKKELTGLLHDMVWLLAEFVKEPRITTH